ncbi:MAG: hypothetical protein WAU02_01950 [Candidatus Saccharimonadales bacterium]
MPQSPEQKVERVIRDMIDFTPERCKSLLHDNIRAKAAKAIFDRRIYHGIQSSLDAITGGRCSRMQLSWLRDRLREIAVRELEAATA